MRQRLLEKRHRSLQTFGIMFVDRYGDFVDDNLRRDILNRPGDQGC